MSEERNKPAARSEWIGFYVEENVPYWFKSSSIIGVSKCDADHTWIHLNTKQKVRVMGEQQFIFDTIRRGSGVCC